MTLSAIKMTARQISKINYEAEIAYPMEACGLITGLKINSDVLRVIKIVPAQNILAPEANHRFEIDPRTRINLEKEIRGTEENLIAHYHSHPDHPALPSSTDLQNVHEPNLIWIIVSVNRGKSQGLTAHRVLYDKSGFREIKILID